MCDKTMYRGNTFPPGTKFTRIGQYRRVVMPGAIIGTPVAVIPHQDGSYTVLPVEIREKHTSTQPDAKPEANMQELIEGLKNTNTKGK